MSMHPKSLPPIPEEIAQIARAAYRKGSVVMRLRDAIGPIYDDEAFAHLFANRPSRPGAGAGVAADGQVAQ